MTRAPDTHARPELHALRAGRPIFRRAARRAGCRGRAAPGAGCGPGRAAGVRPAPEALIAVDDLALDDLAVGRGRRGGSRGRGRREGVRGDAVAAQGAGGRRGRRAGRSALRVGGKSRNSATASESEPGDHQQQPAEHGEPVAAPAARARSAPCRPAARRPRPRDCATRCGPARLTAAAPSTNPARSSSSDHEPAGRVGHHDHQPDLQHRPRRDPERHAGCGPANAAVRAAADGSRPASAGPGAVYSLS